VAGAARELQVDHSTISRRLSALEEAMGAKLLIRGGREFSWTAEGKAVVEAAEVMEAAVETALRAVRSSKVDVEGSVRVSVAPAFAQILMRWMLPGLRELHPLLTVQLESSFLRADLAKGEADIAVRMSRPEEPDLLARRGFDCAWFAYASASYLESHGVPKTHDDLAQHALVLYTELLHRAPPTRWLEQYKSKARATSRVDSLETATQTATAGAGIAVIPAFVGDPIPELARVFPDAVAQNTGWVVYHDCVRNNSRVRLVADVLLDFFRCREWMFLGQCEPASEQTSEAVGKPHAVQLDS
jgi:DNA-binding transcriptional LysR family regulator